MFDKNLSEIVSRHNGLEKNEVCCIEEMSELTKVLTKALRNSPKFNKENLIEELGHVMLMCGVIAYSYNIDENDIYEAQKIAVDRMYDNK